MYKKDISDSNCLLLFLDIHCILLYIKYIAYVGIEKMVVFMVCSITLVQYLL